MPALRAANATTFGVVRRVVLLALVPLLVFGACGDDDDPSSSTATSTTSTTSTTEGVKPNVFAFCDARRDLLALVGTVDRSDPEALRELASGNEYGEVAARMVRAAPVEVRADVELLDQPIQAFVGTGDYDAFVDAASAPDQVDAEQRVALFVTASCAG